jgi:hypothetical protein
MVLRHSLRARQQSPTGSFPQRASRELRLRHRLGRKCRRRLRFFERGGEGLWAGSSLGLVTGFQTRDNARITWVGCVQLFSDDYANKPLPSCVKPRSSHCP